MDKKKILIIAGVAIVLYLLFRGSSDSKSKDETEAGNAFSNAANALTSGISTVATAASVQKSQEDEEYQNLLAEYKRLNGGTLPRGATSLTYAQLQTAIKSLKDLQVAINNYYEIEDDSIQMTADQLALKGIDTAEEVNALINEVRTRQKKEAWASKKKYIDGLVASFIKNIDEDGTYANPKPFDPSIMNSLLNLLPNERVYANQSMYAQGGVETGNHYGGSCYRVYTITEAISPGNRTWRRANRELAEKVKEEYATVAGSVNEFGEIM